MIMDKLIEFADGVTMTQASDTSAVILGNVIDTAASPTLKNLGNGEPVYLVVQIDTTMTAGASAITFGLCSDSTANLATSKTVHILLPTLTTVTAVKGYTYVAALPSTETYERYLGMWQTASGATLTAGAVSAFLTTKAPFQYATFLPDAV